MCVCMVTCMCVCVAGRYHKGEDVITLKNAKGNYYLRYSADKKQLVWSHCVIIIIVLLFILIIIIIYMTSGV